MAKATIQFCTEPETAVQLNALAAEQDRSVSQICDIAVRFYLANQPTPSVESNIVARSGDSVKVEN